MKQALDIKLFSAEDIAKELGMSYLSIQRLLIAGRLKGFKISNKWHVPEENFRSFLLTGGADLDKPRAQHHKKVVSIQHKCIICKEKIDPKNDIFVSYVGNRDLHSCSNEHQNEWKHMTPAEQKKLLSSTKAPASSTAPSNAYRTKIEKFTERDRKRNEAQ